MEAAEPTDAVNDAAVDDAALDAPAAEPPPEAEPVAVELPLLEAALFSTRGPLTAARLADVLEVPTAAAIRPAVKQLNAQYEQTNRSFRIEHVAGGFVMLTLPRFGDRLGKLHAREADAKLTRPALETLAVIAYKQPVLRAEIEAIRGVACGETVRSLMEKRLVKIAGRAEEPGRPILYGTTKRFLEVFGLSGLRDLPPPEDAIKR